MNRHVRHALLLARTVRHLRPAQVAHRVRLRAQRRLFASYGPAITPRWRRSRGATGWPTGFTPLDEHEARGYPDAEANAAGTFSFCNETRRLGNPPDWDQANAEQLWRYHLHYFEWAWAFAAPSDRERGRRLFTDLWRSWRAATAFGRSDAWSPYVASLRAWTFCGLHSSLIANTGHEDDFVADLALHARYVRANVEFDVGGNHLVKNLKALVGLGVFFDDDHLLRFAVRHLYRQVHVQVLDDGGHFERSPSYHCQVLGDLIDVRDLLQAAGRPAGEWLNAAVESMRGWLGAILMPDEGLPLFNDCLPVPSERLRLLEPGSRPLDRLTVLGPSGYVICRPDDRLYLLADVGPPCPAELPAHAHADCLTFELAVDGQRVITDTGTSTYENGDHRAYERSTAAHSTVVVNGADQTEVWGQFRAARRAHPRLHRAEQHGPAITIAASHDGYRRLRGKAVHTRIWYCVPGRITVKDQVAASAGVDVCARFHLAPNLRLARHDSGLVVGNLYLTADGGELEVIGEGVEWAAVGFGRRLPKQVLQVRTHEQHAELVTHLTLAASPRMRPGTPGE